MPRPVKQNYHARYPNATNTRWELESEHGRRCTRQDLERQLDKDLNQNDLPMALSPVKNNVIQPSLRKTYHSFDLSGKRENR
ncbi:hypothetical protein FC093_09990 [Ilyomonas limi]|uniref:Uncharacterized protein n=1 Tax=Ilyomonas limi TaxID=2575867 RepID=A0A4V5UUG1_9BACT|nr:hypothetical protein [Ilyomonas limi]TKK69013.1 hypothetical protein FC093_09990 [Ilyomonas limi]